MEPRFKEGKMPKRPSRGLRRVGKKAQRNMDELADARPALLERSRGRCEAQWSQLCTGIGVHPHHIVRRSQGGDNTPDNLLLVCYFCHDLIHHNPAEALVRGYLRPPWAGDVA